MAIMLFYIILAVVVGWLGGLTFMLYKTRRHYFHLVRRTGRERLDEILETLISHDESVQKEVGLLKQELAKAADDSRFYFQKMGLVRYSAFNRAGADQSFVLSLLDRENSGIIINFIYTHEGVRIYTKRVRQGKGEEYQLSDEEQTAIKTSK